MRQFREDIGMKLNRRAVLLGVAAAAAVCPLVQSASAQTPWPQDRVVTVVVPFAAGGTSDILGRTIAERLSQRLGQRFIVENKAGAGGNIGVASVARAAGDGYTLAMGTVSTHAINPNVYKNMPFDHVKDFTPVSLVAMVPNLLMVNPSMPAKTVPELIDLLKKNPGKYSYGSSGAGTSIHMAGELFKIMAGVDIVHVPYRSSAQVTQDLLGGNIQLTFDNITVAWPQIQAGNIRALATATPQRITADPSLPTMSEFLPGFASTSWHGLFAPSSTPKAITDRLTQEVMAIMKEPAVMESMAKVGVTPVGSNQADFVKLITEETKVWGEVARKANVRID
jgi:tripartite-type tricarboxylate transporter receptor subunit TctC